MKFMSHIPAVLSFGIKSGKQEETFFFLVQDQIYLEQFKTTQNDYDDIGVENYRNPHILSCEKKRSYFEEMWILQSLSLCRAWEEWKYLG